MAFLSPRQMVDSMNIKRHSTIIDIGAGSGAYIYEACRVNGSAGKIIAVDIDADKLKRIEDTARIGGYIVDTLLVNIESGLPLPDYSADYVILANTLHQVDAVKRKSLVAEVGRIMAPHAYLLFVEWKAASKIGPSKEMIIEESEMMEIFNKNNFKIVKELDAGDYHCAYILEK